jgi:hypothetical protein
VIAHSPSAERHAQRSTASAGLLDLPCGRCTRRPRPQRRTIRPEWQPGIRSCRPPVARTSTRRSRWGQGGEACEPFPSSAAPHGLEQGLFSHGTAPRRPTQASKRVAHVERHVAPFAPCARRYQVEVAMHSWGKAALVAGVVIGLAVVALAGKPWSSSVATPASDTVAAGRPIPRVACGQDREPASRTCAP